MKEMTSGWSWEETERNRSVDEEEDGLGGRAMEKKDTDHRGHASKVESAARRAQDTESTSDTIGNGSHAMPTRDSLLRVRKEVVDRQTSVQALDTRGVCIVKAKKEAFLSLGFSNVMDTQPMHEQVLVSCVQEAMAGS